ncbi:MAG: N-acetylmuramoyl-L-alanine amidase [Desulfovibrio sp.]|nr:N-acetylmuramoyl-L-alanine amidase [Desulfovibrio sp.]
MDAYRKRTVLKHPLTRILLAPCCFILALCVLVITFQDLGYSALPPTNKRYIQAKDALATLAADKARARYRSSWEKLIQEFQAIYESDPSWPNRPCALFRKAEAQEGLAKNSFTASDAKKARDTFLDVAQTYPQSILADDALYNAARLSAAWLRDDKKALALIDTLKQRYPNGDMITDAKALEASLLASKGGTLSSKEETQKIIASEMRVVDDKEPSNIAQTKEARLSNQYKQSKKRARELLSDSNRSCWRQPWETLEADFLRFYNESKNDTLRAASLFRAAQSRLCLARCSHRKNDYKSAQELFLSLPENFPQSVLADDALLEAAKILETNLDKRSDALRILTELVKAYPSGDKKKEALAILSSLTAKNSEPAELTALSWESPSAKKVVINLELSKKPVYKATLVRKNKGQSLCLDLDTATIAPQIRKGATVTGSLLTRIFVEHPSRTRSLLYFDLREAKRFSVDLAPDERSLLLTIDAEEGDLKNIREKGREKRKIPQKDEDPDELLEAEQNTDNSLEKRLSKNAAHSGALFGMAEQLGLSVKTVFIDAGHGGKDPGTYHNNIVEKFVAMDVAKTLGRLLENNGFEVIFSRKSDIFIPLSRRSIKANQAGADLFISIHVNANESKQVHGFETYYLDLARTPEAVRVAALENRGSDRRLKDMQKLLAKIMMTARVDESRTLAVDIQRRTLSRLKRNGNPAKNNGIKSAPFHVLIGTEMPAVLVELGYCSNDDEAKNLASARYRDLLAQGLAEGIMAYRDRLQKQETVVNALTKRKSGAM